MKIERWQDHDQLVEGQLVTDAAGNLWKIAKFQDETWLLPYVPFSSLGTSALGDDAPFPLTVVKVVPVEDAGP